MVELRRIGVSDLETPPLILGGNVFGWTADRDTSFEVLDAFVAGGGRMVDTADVYSAWIDGHKGGESETLIGEWLKARGNRGHVIITTKVGMLPGDGGDKLAPARIRSAVDASLKRLQTDYIDLYLAHQDDPDQDQAAVADAFDTLVKQGKVRVIGASNFTSDRLESAIDAQASTGTARYQALQNQYNLLERSEFEGAVQRFCVENEISMTPYYSLASGYLSGKYRSEDDLKGKARDAAARKYMEGRGPQVLEVLDSVADATGASQAQIALAWLAAQPGVTAPIASATSVAQVEELIGAMHLTLDSDQLEALDEASLVGEPA